MKVRNNKMGKGSERRPMDKSHCSTEEFSTRWDKIFGLSELDKKKLDKLVEQNTKKSNSK